MVTKTVVCRRTTSGNGEADWWREILSRHGVCDENADMELFDLRMALFDGKSPAKAWSLLRGESSAKAHACRLVFARSAYPCIRINHARFSSLLADTMNPCGSVARQASAERSGKMMLFDMRHVC